MPLADPWFYACAVPAVLISGISKGGFGGGVGFVAVPLMALLISPIQAAAIMLPILCTMDLFGLWAYRRVWHRRNIAIMIPGAALGIAVGALGFRYLDESLVRLMIGAIAVGFTLNHWLVRKAGAAPRGPSVARGGAWAAFAGFTSFVAHAGGPPVQLYLLPQHLDRTLFVGTTVIFYFFLNYAKLLPYGLLGQFTPENLATAALLLPLTPLGMWLGIRLHRIVSEAWFYRLCYAMLFVTGLKLLWDGLSAQLGAGA